MKTHDNIFCLLIRGMNLSTDEMTEISRFYEELGRDAVYAQMQKKKILPFAASAFVHCGLDLDFWQEVLEQYRKRNWAILCCLDQAYEELDRQGVRKMFVTENFGALLMADNDLAMFASGDVDNHADPSEKEKIYRAFEVLGYTRKERFSGKHQIAAEFFPPTTEGLPEKFYISVDFYPLARLKLPCFIRSNDFVDWDKLSCYANTSVKLPPADALMYICMLHISLHSFSRAPDIRLYIDLLNMSRTLVDFEKLVKWCERDCTCTRVAAAAHLANLLMGTRLPDKLVNLSKRRHKLIRLVFDDKKNDLRYEPKGLKVLWIELRCNDRGCICGLSEILFPNRDWMKQVYGSTGIGAYLKHFCKVL